MGKLEENKLHKKQKLMSTAFDLFTTKGIIRTSISDIVEKSGVAKGTFYLYFHDKYDLQEKLIIHKAQQLFSHAIERSDCQNAVSVQDKVIAIVDDILYQLAKDKKLLQFINKNLSWGVFRHAMDSQDYLCPEVFKELFDVVDTKRASVLVYMIVEMIGSTSYNVILNNDPVTLDEFRPYLERSVRLIMDGFLADAAVAKNDAAQ